MKKFDIYKATGNYDEDGRYDIGYFTSSLDAAAAAKGKGGWGRDGDVKPVEITIYESFEEYQTACQEGIRTHALSKLTEAEKTALGLCTGELNCQHCAATTPFPFRVR